MALADVRERLAELAENLRWTWSGEFDSLFREIDELLWRKVNHNPHAFLVEVEDAKIEACGNDHHYMARLERARMSLRAYLVSEQHWANRNASALNTRPVAYFSAELGLHESLPIYSGGLGILAGDHLKSASDLGIPIWGISILYRDGYFTQTVQEDGQQAEAYIDLDLEQVPVERFAGKDGQPLSLRIGTGSHDILVHLWRVRVGRVSVVLLEGSRGLLDTEPHTFSRRLYGGDQRTRLLQELMLGVAGYRALRLLGVRPGVLHLNEGHSAFALLEAVADIMEEDGASFADATERVRAMSVFTTHTPVAAGHDRFPPQLIDTHLGSLRRRLGLSSHDFLALGRVRPEDPNEPFCMTVLALKLACRANAVSAIHGGTSRSMWRNLWPTRDVREVPISHITNGAHVPSWIAPKMAQLFERTLKHDWLTHIRQPAVWHRIHDVDPFEIWDVKCQLKKKMLSFVQRRCVARHLRIGVAGECPVLNPDALTIGFARRFVEYKRAHILLRDRDRLARLLNDPARPVQIIFAGKAHPNDEMGKKVLQEVFLATKDPRFVGKITVLENHDMNMARHLLQGCDVWVNAPRRPLEACGTSGQKAVFNGTLNLSVLDGWWAEAYDGRNGYAFGKGLSHADSRVQDERDGAELIEVLETQVLPDFFERSREGFPPKWIERIQHALATLAWRYNSDRMIVDYVTQCYLPAAGMMTSRFSSSP